MENFNKNSLKAAVKAYGSLHSDGKAEAEVKEALLADEKGYSTEQVDSIYDAIVNPEPTAPKVEDPKSYVVAKGKSFRDKDNFAKEYSAGESLDGFSQDRIDHLLSIGYIEEA